MPPVRSLPVQAENSPGAEGALGGSTPRPFLLSPSLPFLLSLLPAPPPPGKGLSRSEPGEREGAEAAVAAEVGAGRRFRGRMYVIWR